MTMVKRYVYKTFLHYVSTKDGQVAQEVHRGDELELEKDSQVLHHYESHGMVGDEPVNDPTADDVPEQPQVLRLSAADAADLQAANERVAAAEAKVDEMKSKLKSERTANTKAMNHLQKQLDDALAGLPAESAQQQASDAEQEAAGDPTGESEETAPADGQGD